MFDVRDITELQWLVSRLALSTREANLDEMLSLIELCGMLEVSNIVRNTSNFHTYPGTLWCGPGDSASSYSELGANTAVDRCCRNHDFCPVRASPGEITVPVVWGKEHSGESVNLFTVSHCHCDKVFKRCLHEAGTTERVTARAMIFLYEAAIRQCIGDNGQLVEQHVNLWDLF
ncbi:hypothetical protein BIW11_06567 [Tropilaelaps mercedesae]|uniref:Phospholipase A2-like central domain-containing protein n=1 Tax=Tropilaelaps mercedesae TaxID=418985 RepID=A0A1V9XXE4_9ACAR|nr:hypothetical protein BIW11_06567 [Tropilaelaps mercedesae]